MSVDDTELNNKSLITIKEKFFSGKAALEEPELKRLYIEFEEELRKSIEKRELGKNEELTRSFLEIFKTTLPGEFAYTLMTALNENLYYDFGLYLVDEAKSSPDNSNLFHLVHEYLSLFRTPSFLKKIYEDKLWEELVHELIKTSNYNIPALFSQCVREYGEKSLFTEIKGNKLNSISWNETKTIVVKYAKSFFHFIKNENPDKAKVAFLLENNLQMPLLDLACLTTGIVNVMIPSNSVSEHILFIINQTESSLLILHDEKQLAKIKSIKSELKFLKQAVILFGNSSEDWVISFNDFVEQGKDVKNEELDSIRNKITMNSLASIMYTSGTTGEPKGIMFSQMNIVYKRFSRAMALPEIGDADRFLAFLPLFHTFGRWLEMMGSIFWGAEYYFMENPAVETMIANMKLIKPTIFISIPKKWLQLYEQITARIDIETEEDKVIKGVVRELTGGELKWGLSAAGYLPPDVFRFFQNYGIELMSGFGMTEATGGITMTPPKRYKENSLGRALPGIQIKLGEDGEILIKGSYVMEGYYGKSFEETFTKDGWLPTGDVMKMDENGFIEIIDRKKEIYKNIKGETIAPQKIENLFREFETVKQVFLVGDHRPFNTVLIYPDYSLENSPLTELDEKSTQEFFSS
ncbi:MAG: AMP-binding protein, partial [Ignavibacteria bacterium]